MLLIAYAVAVWIPHHSVVNYGSCQGMFNPAQWFGGCSAMPLRVALLAVGLVAATMGVSVAVKRSS